jgi:hypothetical protein
MFSLRLKISAKLYLSTIEKNWPIFSENKFSWCLRRWEKNGFDVCLLPTNWKRSESLNGRRSSLKGALSH